MSCLASFDDRTNDEGVYIDTYISECEFCVTNGEKMKSCWASARLREDFVRIRYDDDA